MPQDQNSGGFYLALFKKNVDYVVEEVIDEKFEEDASVDNLDNLEDETENGNEINEITEEKPKEVSFKKPINPFSEPKLKLEKPNKYQTNSESKFIPLPTEIWMDLKTEFGFSDSFPSHLLYVPSEKYKAIYMVTPKIAEYLKNDYKSALKMVIFGTVMFQKSRAEAETPNNYRISQSGIHFLKPFMTKNVIHISFEELKFFLTCNGSVSHENISNEKSIDANKFLSLKRNSYCLVYKPSEANSDEELFMVSKMADSIVVMVPKEDVAGFKIKYNVK